MIELDLGDDHCYVVLLAAQVVLELWLRVLGKWWQVFWVGAEFVCFFRDDVSNILRVVYVTLERLLHEWPDKLFYLVVKEIIKHAVWADQKYVIVLNVMLARICFCRVVAAGAYLKREIESVSLLLWAEKCLKLVLIFSEEHVARISEITRVKGGNRRV